MRENSIVPNEGSTDAEIIFIGESPASEEVVQGRPFVGRAGRVLDQGLKAAGIERGKARLVNLIRKRAPHDKFQEHSAEDVSWGKEEFAAEVNSWTKAKVIVPLGGNPLAWLTGLSPISNWRGSPLKFNGNANEIIPEEYLNYAPAFFPATDSLLQRSPWIVPTFHPSAVARNYEDHPLFISDLRKAKRILETGEVSQQRRRWFVNQPWELQRIIDREKELGMVAVDTEQSPEWIVGIATEDEVHVFTWDAQYEHLVRRILESKLLLKVAHNVIHDWSWFWKEFRIKVEKPYADTMGMSHVLNQALEKSLSPGIASRFTDWPFHKWLWQTDAHQYCGMDAVVCFDSYWPIMEKLFERDLYQVYAHDNKLLEPLLDMHWFGFRIDEEKRASEEVRLLAEKNRVKAELQVMVKPIIDQKLSKFEKPHLFEVERKCSCCGGGKTQRDHCWRCSGFVSEPEKKDDFHSTDSSTCSIVHGGRKCTIKAHRAGLQRCQTCNGIGKVKKRLEFNPESSDQVADVLYRGLGIRARKYKGKETIRVGQLEELAERQPVVSKLIESARTTADYETVHRLAADLDGRLHCVFDPFGTDSGRVASKEGLIYKGTNAMNIPKPSRVFVIPDAGNVLLYPDMKQIELRAMALLSKDKQLIEWFNDPKMDVHKQVRDLIRDQLKIFISRDQVKRLEYAAGYGGSAPQLSIELTNEFYQRRARSDDPDTVGVELDVGKTAALIEFYFHLFPGLRQWHLDVERELLEHRRVTSVTGRQRYWLGYIKDSKTKKNPTPGVKHEIIKQAWSFVPQDIGAWILAEGIIDLYNSDDWHWLRGLIHVHDAVVMQAPMQRVEEAKEIAIKALTRKRWGMSFEAEMKVGMNWKEAS